MNARTRPPNPAAPLGDARKAATRPEDAALNEQMTSLLRQAAEARDDRLRARTLEDDDDGRRATEALYALVGHGPGTRRR
jgi:hypothetical protein